MQLYARWSIAGVVTEGRELTSQKNKNWRGYVIKVATLGQAFEVTATAEQFHQIAAGQHLVFDGHFEEQKGDKGVFVKYILDEFCDAADTPTKKAGAA